MRNLLYGRELAVASDTGDFVAAIGGLLRDPERAAAMGTAARTCVLARYGWEAHLSRIDRYLEAPATEAIHAA